MNPEHLEIVRRGKKAIETWGRKHPGETLDLAWATLSGADLSGADLSGADLTGANLTRADLSGADLQWAILSGANLTGAILTRADLSGADLTGANLTGANLSFTNAYAALWGDRRCFQYGPVGSRRDSLILLQEKSGTYTYYAGCRSGDSLDQLQEIVAQEKPVDDQGYNLAIAAARAWLLSTPVAAQPGR